MQTERENVTKGQVDLPSVATAGDSVAGGRLPVVPRSQMRRRRLVLRALVLSDVAALALAYLAAEAATGDLGALFGSPVSLALVAGVPAWLVGAKLFGLYDADDKRPDHSTVDDFPRIFHLLTAGVFLFLAVAIVAGASRDSLGVVVAFWLFALVATSLGRSLARAVVRRRPGYVQNTIIVGAGDIGQLIARKFLLHPEYGINVVGFADRDGTVLPPDLDQLALLGPPEALPDLVRLLDVERVVVSFWHESDEQALDLVRSLRNLDVRIDIAPRLHDIIGPTAGIHSVEGFPLVGLPALRLSRSSRVMKRAMDLVASVVGLVALIPVFALIALLIKLDSRGPVFFRQVRLGAGDRVFKVYKFRTMRLDADELKAELAHLNAHSRNGGDARLFKIADDPRVTRVGRMLRRYFLDELPQLINVLKGEMSLVGPRPLILDEDRHVQEWARRRLDLRPGMTGLWQVLGHSAIPFGEMIKLDYLYVTTWSLRNDVALIFRTIPVVLRGGGGAY